MNTIICLYVDDDNTEVKAFISFFFPNNEIVYLLDHSKKTNTLPSYPNTNESIFICNKNTNSNTVRYRIRMYSNTNTEYKYPIPPQVMKMIQEYDFLKLKCDAVDYDHDAWAWLSQA